MVASSLFHNIFVDAKNAKNKISQVIIKIITYQMNGYQIEVLEMMCLSYCYVTQNLNLLLLTSESMAANYFTSFSTIPSQNYGTLFKLQTQKLLNNWSL